MSLPISGPCHLEEPPCVSGSLNSALLSLRSSILSLLGRTALGARARGHRHGDPQHCRAPSPGLVQPASLGAEI